MIDFQEHLDATQIRELYFQENSNLNFIKSVVPDTTLEFLIEYKKEVLSRATVLRPRQKPDVLAPDQRRVAPPAASTEIWATMVSSMTLSPIAK